MAKTNKQLIEVENLCKTYDNGEVKTKAVCNVSLKIHKGEFVSIMGPSGSGKSTLMQMLGLLEKPTSGIYRFKNKNVDQYNEDELAELRNEELGFVFQSFNLLPRTTVYENVELPLLYDAKIDKKKNRQKIEKAIESVGLTHRKEYLSNQISGGQKQRVAIARALVNDPQLVFADEPTGNLDTQSGIKVLKILSNLNQQNKTIILVTHEEKIAKYAKRILRIKDGSIIKDEILRK